MRIYFCGAILGGRDHLAVYRHVVAHLESYGHTVPTRHVAHLDVLEEERVFTAREVFERDIAWLRMSDTVIAEISTPSLGVGYEIALGLQRGMPVLCVYRQGLQVSKMITGNPAPHLRIQTYENLDELDRHIDAFLNSCAPRCR